MKISEEMLNLHEQASWQQEFGLNERQLHALLMYPTRDLVEIFKAHGAFINLFTNRVASEFFIGEEINLPSTFKMLRASAVDAHDYALITSTSNNSNLAELSKFSQHLTIGYCLIVKINDVENRICGFCAFYGKKFPGNISGLSNIINLYKQSLVDKLLLEKHKRLSRDQNELQELIVDTNIHPIFAKDIDSRIVFSNQAFVSMYPESMHEKIIGFTTVEEYDAKQHELFLADDREAFEKGSKSVVEKIDFPNGSSHVLETTKRHFKTSAGKDFILGVSYDLTKQYQLIETLKKKNQDMDEIANMLASDVRAPANAMVKLISWLQDDVAQVSDLNTNIDDINDTIVQLKANANRVSKLLATMHDYCFAGRDRLANSSISMTSMVSDILSQITTKRKIETKVDDATLLLPRTPFYAVMLAVISNAIEHCQAQEMSLSIDVKKSKSFYTIAISNTGMRVEEINSERIFALFETTVVKSDDVVKGAGLAIARKIVEGYSGEIYLDKDYEKGARFVIEWPL